MPALHFQIKAGKGHNLPFPLFMKCQAIDMPFTSVLICRPLWPFTPVSATFQSLWRSFHNLKDVGVVQVKVIRAEGLMAADVTGRTMTCGPNNRAVTSALLLCGAFSQVSFFRLRCMLIYLYTKKKSFADISQFLFILSEWALLEHLLGDTIKTNA